MVRIVGDVHGKILKYVDIVKDVSHSVQVGDMGFEYSQLNVLSHYHHVFFGGNHENYDTYYDTLHRVGNGNYGKFTLDNLDLFFIRGEFSIDKAVRLKYERLGLGKGWWIQEELNDLQMKMALNSYEKVKPKIMLSHGCPDEIARMIGNPKILQAYGFDDKKFTTCTQTLLQNCFDIHQPDIWVFGHFHMNLDFPYKNTRFICLSELSYIDLLSDGRLINKNRIKRI